MSKEDFDNARNYLMKNVYLLTSTQNAQLGYSLDSDWYGIPEYTAYMRDKLGKLTRADVNAAVKRHLSPQNLSIVIITQDAQALRDALVADAFSPIKYDAEKPAALLEEDKVIGALKLNIRPDAVRVTPVGDVFAK
jgi:zinc protease